MRTSAAGNSHLHRPAAGFTLIELLVVVAIIAFATAGVGFALRDTARASLDREAERLVALLEAGRAQARASGASVRWRVTAQGFVFDGVPPGALPQGWQMAGVSAQPLDEAGRPVTALLLGPEPIIGAQQVLIRSEGPPAQVLRLATDGLRPFAVVDPGAP
ncbi:Tfp pilus assembly protein FimT/FimU [Pseudacidovorax sp. RU35E]|uniref:pilus assembly FimT family protein n=1 Tax=Pseudacidovorax sp. RU35E TaxID=1907403 RepID=UPI0009539F3B|nr:prepilin-type N-terminal cleavage/methylation domain-containing protein [Pseudacidovorax sp. RU35E]SIR19560.1 general secretion pathway protein H [Pseudacidovorax sp. RU35E]